MNKTDKERVDLLNKWFTQEEIKALNALLEKGEVIKTANRYPNLFTQACNSMEHIANLKEKAFESVVDLDLYYGDYIADALVKSIYSEFIQTFEPFSVEMGNYNQDAFREFANNTFSKIDAAERLRGISRSFSTIHHLKTEIELALKGVLR